MIRRFLRVGFIAGLVGGAGFALFKLVQSRRASHELPPSSDWLPPKRPEKPLVEPEMLHGLALKKSGEPVADEAGEAGEPMEKPEPEPGPTPDDEAAAPTTAWVEPEGTTCPASHPVKGKLSSGIFHLPGMLAYERTTPDRCYVDEAAAESDGLRKAKR